LSSEAKKIGLHISDYKTKIMELLESDEDLRVTEDLMYEKYENFKYLGATLSMKNDWAKEIGIRISKTERTFFAMKKCLGPNASLT
jgi:hypothetical protein